MNDTAEELQGNYNELLGYISKYMEGTQKDKVLHVQNNRCDRTEPNVYQILEGNETITPASLRTLCA